MPAVFIVKRRINEAGCWFSFVGDRAQLVCFQAPFNAIAVLNAAPAPKAAGSPAVWCMCIIPNCILMAVSVEHADYCTIS